MAWMCVPKVCQWKTNLLGVLRRWSLWEVMRSWQQTLMNRINALLRQVQEPPYLLLPCETQQAVGYLGDGLHWTTPVPWPPLPVSTTLRSELLLFLTTQPVVFCHHHQNRPDRDPGPYTIANTESFPDLIFYFGFKRKKKITSSFKLFLSKANKYAYILFVPWFILMNLCPFLSLGNFFLIAL